MRRFSIARLAVVVVFLALAGGQARAGEPEDTDRLAEAVVHWRNGYVLHLTGRYEEAAKLFEQSIAAYPTAEGHTFLGWSLSELGRLEDAIAERFIRTLKENLLWVRTFETIEDLRLALIEFAQWYNTQWLVARHGPRTSHSPRPGACWCRTRTDCRRRSGHRERRRGLLPGSPTLGFRARGAGCSAG